MEEEISLNRLEEFLDHGVDVLLQFSVKIASALVVLAIGILVIRLLRGIIKKIVEKKEVDPTVSGFLLNMISWLLKLLLFIAVISKLGVETSSFVAVLGAMGLAIGLSLQGSLSNFTGGLLIIMFKPFRVGDYIEAQGVGGTVKQIQVFNTQINSDNNQAIFIPNGILSNGTVINYSRETNRRANLKITVATDNDLEKVNRLLLQILQNNPKVLKNPAPAVALSEIIEGASIFYLRPWAARKDFSAMVSEILFEIKTAFERENIKTPTQSIEVLNR
ncbi:MAG: mechanosensitive ion channel domain-containing protein [Flavobacteriaceae bacterium]